MLPADTVLKVLIPNLLVREGLQKKERPQISLWWYRDGMTRSSHRFEGPVTALSQEDKASSRVRRVSSDC